VVRVDMLPGGLLPFQGEAEYVFSGFIPTNKRTNKQTLHIGGDMYSTCSRGKGEERERRVCVYSELRRVFAEISRKLLDLFVLVYGVRPFFRFEL